MWNRLVLPPLLAMLTALAQAEVVKFEVLHTVPDDAGQPGANSERQGSRPGVTRPGVKSCPLPSDQSTQWLRRYSNKASRVEKGKS